MCHETAGQEITKGETHFDQHDNRLRSTSSLRPKQRSDNTGYHFRAYSHDREPMNNHRATILQSWSPNSQYLCTIALQKSLL